MSTNTWAISSPSLSTISTELGSEKMVVIKEIRASLVMVGLTNSTMDNGFEQSAAGQLIHLHGFTNQLMD